MKKKLLAVTMVCMFTLGIALAGFGFEAFVERPPGATDDHFNGGPGPSPPPRPHFTLPHGRNISGGCSQTQSLTAAMHHIC